MRTPPGKVVFIVGPTAIGKTSLAVRLARRIDAEIISADSMQIYNGMKILSQAPTAEEKRKARHHLVESIDPRKEYSVAEFIKKATAAINAITKRGRLPIIAGGSGLYIKGLIDGLFESPKADLKFRAKMARFAAKNGRKKLYAKLVKIDPDAAKTIHPNDLRRVVRALEIYHTAGKTMTELKASTRGLKDACEIKIFGLIRPRGEMYSRIDSRVDGMFRSGAVAEVKRLRRRKLSRTAAAVLGFKEISGYLDGECTLDEAKELLKMNTRRFAKRQMTWFRANDKIKWFDAGKLNNKEIIKKITKELR
ncbi:MAG: tRNA (adenosine(37)-N6)-dimethylallyltransferase MiaA [Candidatus Omnitrophica bacterium]|nr:tRNA (adenosine(37)-N6)-dimethylallyltransferase MiaA [Candidatus Omnitrophota bacterium]